MPAQNNFDQLFESVMASAETSRRMLQIQSQALTEIATNPALSTQQIKDIAFNAIQNSSRVLINKEVVNA